MQITLLTGKDIEPLVRHVARQIGQSGRDGAVIYTPQPPGGALDLSRMRDTRAAGWMRSTDQPGWWRTFGLWDGGRIVGHGELHGGRLTTELHRAELGMGIEAEFRSQGHGKRLLDHLLDWARKAGLTWIDLGVFENNAPAQALYRAAGFEEVGRRIDQFRVEGESITDIQMSLRLR